MKRRNFLKCVAAFASAPVLPVKLSATPLPVSAEQYAKAVHWAGLWVHSTAATYKNVLGVDYQVAKAVFERLQQDGILGALDANGIARAVIPHYEVPQVAARIKKAMAKPVTPATGSVKAPQNELSKVNAGTRPAPSFTHPKHDTSKTTAPESAARPTPRPLRQEEVRKLTSEA